MKKIADFLTASRLLISLVIVVMGFIWGVNALPALIYLLIIGWTTDVLDGMLARLEKKPYDSWFGKNEFNIDMVMTWSAFFFLTLIGIIPLWLFVVYSLLPLILTYFFHSKTLVMSFAAPLSFLPLYISLSRSMVEGYIYLVWIIIMLIFNWKRFTFVVSSFVDGLTFLKRRGQKI